MLLYVDTAPVSYKTQHLILWGERGEWRGRERGREGEREGGREREISRHSGTSLLTTRATFSFSAPPPHLSLLKTYQHTRTYIHSLTLTHARARAGTRTRMNT